MKKFIHLIRSVKFVLPALLVVLLLGACGSQGAEKGSNQNPVIHIGVQGKTGILPYAREKKYFEKAFEKEGVKAEWHEFASGPPHFEALASGRIDFGATGGTPLIAGQSGGVDFRGIAVTSDGKKGNSIIVPKDSSIKELKDLKGKKVAVAKGSSAYNFLYMALDRAGLKDSDIQLIQLQPDEARPALDNGSVDAWSTWEPYSTTAVFQTEAKILASGEDLNINAPSFLVARTKFTKEHPELTVTFLKTYEEARKHVTENIDEVSEEIAKKENLDVEIIKTVLKKSEFILSPTTDEFAKAHQEQADFLYKSGGINKELDTSKVIDNQFVEEALK
ncbi:MULTISPECIES: aliphatic sulfonate ABC transporter substrate-binding protein [Bacillus]|uniref:Sulfonate transport system substrate-binding protein n=1 Tax=Bacillus capparidis TaxID=1840411 RepID=A0ABS4D1Q7_9BACI|nr:MULTISPECIES: aliphatic sulfonate ABC transporter substrate-binding protein [Bacillus]MBP1083565.1 sulfonate transport system substrate-binding protein [Bacillus capparidis]MED1094759.1 aliphatic sulfonate ABC transporter substrate-binding protein [Bacillus capparidis]